VGSTVFWGYFEVFAANAADKILNEVVIVITLQNVVSVFIVRVSTSTLRLQLTYKFFLIQYLRFPLRVCVASHRVLARLPDLLKAHHFKSSRWFRRGCFCRWWPVKQVQLRKLKGTKLLQRTATALQGWWFSAAGCRVHNFKSVVHSLHWALCGEIPL